MRGLGGQNEAVAQCLQIDAERTFGSVPIVILGGLLAGEFALASRNFAPARTASDISNFNIHYKVGTADRQPKTAG